MDKYEHLLNTIRLLYEHYRGMNGRFDNEGNRLLEYAYKALLLMEGVKL